ncbi:hypothetical protein VTK73DRAFT_1664 [Phialemonium thermophilum]|uniref:F-box domain-containing protein n=1 Tax=Phialemonium thermophilum TaxID=223376 RepID=A0ABR3X8K7_9PEZI
MQVKRRRSPAIEDDPGLEDDQHKPPLKRPRQARVARPTRRALERRSGDDLLSRLSDELLIRILSYLSMPHLLAVAPVSQRFYRLAGDSQLWKALYYARFVLPRAMRIPGFRNLSKAGRDVAAGTGHKLHYSGRRTLWADGRWGGLVAREPRDGGGRDVRGVTEEDGEAGHAVNWKRQYKLRHNWARGKCAVEELRVGDQVGAGGEEGRRMLVKVVEGFAVTADATSGLRAWNLKTRKLLAHASFLQDEMRGDADGDSFAVTPSCLAIDDQDLDNSKISVAVGFVDGSFGVWRLHLRQGTFLRQYMHQKSTNGELIGMAMSYPYLLTATEAVLVSLYTFEIPREEGDCAASGRSERDGRNKRLTKEEAGYDEPKCAEQSAAVAVDGSAWSAKGKGKQKGLGDHLGSNILPAPYLLTSLKSNTSRPPLALSIRRKSATTIASIAYTFSTRRGWSVGLQDLHIHQSSATDKSAPEITTTQLAYTAPIDAGVSWSDSSTSPHKTPTQRLRSTEPGPEHRSPASSSSPPVGSEPGPTTLCYTHPYLLATLPDNTLILYLCTSSASSLQISSGVRLWGHTSGISDAEITARGKAVSVSSRGEEMRVWELEGRSEHGGGGRSVEIRAEGAMPLSAAGWKQGEDDEYGWHERRNWVGFDDEMVIVLKERKDGGESLMVYDFT